MNYNATKNYKQKLNRLEILERSNTFKRIFFENFSKGFNSNQIDPPLIVKYSSDNEMKYFITKSRSINFDSYSKNNIFFEIPINYDKKRKQIIEAYDIKPGNSIFYESSIVRRDIEINNIKAFKWNQLEMEIVLENEGQKNLEELRRVFRNFTEVLKISIKMTKDKYSDINEIEEINVPTIGLVELERKYSGLSRSSKEYMQSIENDLFWLVNDLRNNKGIFKQSFNFDPRVYRQHQHARLMTFLPSISSKMCIAEMAFSCNYQEQLEQFSFYNQVYTSDYMKQLRDGKIRPTLSIKVYLPRILMLIMGLCHIAEVVKSEWDKDFLEFIKKKGMEIL